MADHILFQQSIDSQEIDNPFVARQVLYITDSNSSSYNGVINFYTDAIKNCGKYASYSEAYLEIPFVICCQPTTNDASVAFTTQIAQYCNYMCGLKNGYYQLIHSMALQLDSQSIVQLTNYMNFYINYRLMTSFSENDVKKNGQSIGFYPDTSNSFNYNSSPASLPIDYTNYTGTLLSNTQGDFTCGDGIGLSNNRPFGYENLYPNIQGAIFTDNSSTTNNTLLGSVFPKNLTAQTFVLNVPNITIENDYDGFVMYQEETYYFLLDTDIIWSTNGTADTNNITTSSDVYIPLYSTNGYQSANLYTNYVLIVPSGTLLGDTGNDGVAFQCTNDNFDFYIIANPKTTQSLYEEIGGVVANSLDCTIDAGTGTAIVVVGIEIPLTLTIDGIVYTGTLSAATQIYNGVLAGGDAITLQDTLVFEAYNDNNQFVGYFTIPANTQFGTLPAATGQANNVIIGGFLNLYQNNNTNIISASSAFSAGNYIPGIYTNNQPQYIQSGSVSSTCNYGFYKRMSFTNFNANIAPYYSFTNQLLNTTAGWTSTILKNYFSIDATIPNQCALIWRILARIRLKDIHPIFEQIPLVKGAYFRMFINYNNSSQQVALIDTPAYSSFPISKSMCLYQSPQLQNGTNPLLISSAVLGQGFNPSVINQVPSTIYQFSCNVQNTTSYSGTTYYHNLQNCRLYIPVYQLSLKHEEEYLKINKHKKIVYKDVAQFQTNVSALEQFNFLCTNGISNPQKVIIIPMLQASSNPLSITTLINDYPINGTNSNFSDISLPCYQSPFSTSPATTAPLIALTNFNVKISGVNTMLNTENYDFQNFVDQLSFDGAINGNLVDGLTSGLISEMDYAMSYRYYVVDVSRRTKDENMINKSVEIVGTNASNVNITLFVFVEYLKEFVLDTETGLRV